MKGFWLMNPLPHHSLVSAVPRGGQWVPAAMHIAEIRVRWAGKVSTQFHKTISLELGWLSENKTFIFNQCPIFAHLWGFADKLPNFNFWISVYNNSVINNRFVESISTLVSRHYQLSTRRRRFSLFAPSPNNVSREMWTPLPSRGEGEVPCSPDSAPSY